MIRAFQLFHNVGDEKYPVTVDDDSTFAHVIPLSGNNGTINFVVYNRNLQGQTTENITINIVAKVWISTILFCFFNNVII